MKKNRRHQNRVTSKKRKLTAQEWKKVEAFWNPTTSEGKPILMQRPTMEQMWEELERLEKGWLPETLRARRKEG